MMKVGDAVRVTMEFGKYWHKGVDVAGMYGVILDLIEHDDTAYVLLSCGCVWPLMNSHAWLEVISENR